MSRTCAAPACKRPVSRKHLMCLEHWNRVPLPLRILVEKTWDRFESSALEPGADRLLRLREYRTAQDTAIASLNTQGQTS